MRERRDDFAWENDRIAHRMYGAALETWAQEPLTSSAVDVWFKRTRRLVVNDWYMVDDYHRDTGDGADFYSAGKSRGCGGNGIWADGKLYAVGELPRLARAGQRPDPRDVRADVRRRGTRAAVTVTEIKRITLDAGQNLNRFESRYTVTPAAPVAARDPASRRPPAPRWRSGQEPGMLRTWEPVKGRGQLRLRRRRRPRGDSRTRPRPTATCS